MRFSALLAVPVALVGLAVPAYAEDPDLTITWPAITDVEVPTATYTVNVADTAAEPQGTLYAEWQGERQELPHTGDHAVSFAKGGTGTIKVVRCVPADPEPVCTDTGDVSPELTVWKRLSNGLQSVVAPRQPGDTINYRFDAGQAPGATVAVTWTLRRIGTSTPQFQGQGSITLDAAGSGPFLFQVPAAAETGRHNLDLQYVTDVAPFGPHRGTGFSIIDVDGTAPSVTVGLSASAIYPIRDGYRDSITISAKPSEAASAKVEFVNSASKVVRTISRASATSHSVAFNGRTSGGSLLPAGRYTARVTVTDKAGNKTTVSRALSLSHKRIQKRTWTRTFKAGATLTRNGAFVQACSTLRKPSLRPWAGSLGYYSRTKCHRDNADIVSTTNGIYVPKAFQNRYGTYQVSFYGGGARGTRGAYIVMGYLNNKNAFTHRVQGGAAVRSYKGKVASAGNFVHDKTTKPYVLWTAGLTDGSRYDVKSFTVKLTYTVLA